MIRKSIIGLIVMVAFVGLAFATININNTSSGGSNVSNYTKIPGKQNDLLIKTTSKNSTVVFEECRRALNCVPPGNPFDK